MGDKGARPFNTSMSKLNFETTKIGIIGLGYVGLPLAIEFGAKWETIGFDIDSSRIQELKNSFDRTAEILQDGFESSSFIDFTDSLDALQHCNIFIVTVPTPIDENNLPALDAIKNATKSVCSLLKKGDIVIYESTVYPGLTEEVCVPMLEQSGLTLNNDFYCGYSPERINPGDSQHRLKDIVKVVSGSCQEALVDINALYLSIIDAGTHMAESIKVAEAAKVIENTQRDLNIALVNEFAIIFNKLGLDTQSVLNASNTKWNFLDFRPGLVGGHCIGVDPYYLTYKSKEAGYIPEIILAGRKLNNSMPAYVAQHVADSFSAKSLSHENKTVLILGFTFKENCPDIRNTKIFDLYRSLGDLNMIADVFDPIANNDEIKKTYGINSLLNKPSQKYDAVILAVPHIYFLEMGLIEIKKFCSEDNNFFDLKSVYQLSDSTFRL
jgi:UDP-N-acetyl-D-glucosamine/UDP-N-acetyl-D-galactosamine dehydrogenase